MIKAKEEIRVTTEENAKGEVKMYLNHLNDFDGWNEKNRMFALVELKAGEEVEFHIHENEFESYYILSGKALYTDHDETFEITSGTVTFTPSGKGHGIKNIGDEMLKFIAHIVKD